MKRSRAIALVVLLVAIAVAAFFALRSHEPEYQGKRLSQWLEEYDRIGAMEKTGPASEAIRAMGTNALPYLFAYIKHRDTPLKKKFFGLVQKQHWLKLPPYRENRYFSPALLALKTLGPDAGPLVPELLKVFENPDTLKEGGLALFSIGPASIPALEQACRNSNVLVRADAALFIAKLPRDYTGEYQGYYCAWHKPRADVETRLYIAKVVNEYDIWKLTLMLKSSNAAVRRASADALAIYYHQSNNEDPKSSVRMLVKTLNDPDQDARNSARLALKRIDAAAAEKAGVK